MRRPPRGVAREDFARQNWYDVWYPNLAPSADLVKLALEARDAKEWAKFVKGYRAQMRVPEAVHSLELLAALSKTTDFSVGCYCEDEARCHRSVLRELLREHGAVIREEETRR